MTNISARGGTELMAERIHSLFPESAWEGIGITHSRVRGIDRSKKNVLVLHDLPHDPEAVRALTEYKDVWDAVVFVSHWQRQVYEMAYNFGYPSNHYVCQNFVKSFPKHTVPKPQKGVKLIYFSTPHRGLGLLFHAFNNISITDPDVSLTVYSSFDLYGWGERDEPYKDLFAALQDHPKITYSKSVSNAEIRKALLHHHIFAYPSNWIETSCLCLIEAMQAGLTCVHSSLGALPETGRGQTRMYDYISDPGTHIARFEAELRGAIRDKRLFNLTTPEIVPYTNLHTVENAREQWGKIIKDLKGNVSTTTKKS